MTFDKRLSLIGAERLEMLDALKLIRREWSIPGRVPSLFDSVSKFRSAINLEARHLESPELLE